MAEKNRIGQVYPTHVEYPDVDLSGDAYERPATTRGLAHGRFVVLPAFVQPGFDVEAEIAKLVESEKAKAAEVKDVNVGKGKPE